MDLKKLIKNVVSENSSLDITDEFQKAFDLIEKSSENIFITGKAGTGKSTFINVVRGNSKKKIAVISPTGLSAINVKGQTIHSFFHFPPRLLTEEVIHNFKGNTRIFKATDMIIIDEVSMVRADMLDAIDQFLRKYGRDEFLPFGGCQMVLVGDLYQLPPVVTNSEKQIIYDRYSTPYFFSSTVFKNNNFKIIEFSQIFRQKDEEFIRFLNLVRTGEASSDDLRALNKNVTDKLNDKNITLTTTNSVANAINESHLNEMDSRLFILFCKNRGKFSD